MTVKNAILIAGPTASGKSALALKLARERNGIVVNTDSMQVYDVLEVLTARPNEAERAQAPHMLYGHVHPATPYSVASWLNDAEKVIAEADHQPLIFVGGTGLYFRALTLGLSPVPPIPAEIREYWRARLAEEGAPSLHQLLQKVDPDAARAIKPADGQRIVRALEVHAATGKPLSFWQSQSGQGVVDETGAEKYLVAPDRDKLIERIEMRFDRMIELGALEEVKAIRALNLDPALPAMKAIGVPELSEFLDGKITMDEAISRAKTATRQYAKRQMTWFRNQAGSQWKQVSSV